MELNSQKSVPAFECRDGVDGDISMQFGTV